VGQSSFGEQVIDTEGNWTLVVPDTWFDNVDPVESVARTTK
jgi:hypothetical protein